MANDDLLLDPSIDTDNEEFDCHLGKIPKEHLAVFQRLAKTNGKVNRMKKNQLIVNMKKKELSTEGELDMLRKRLKNYYKRKALVKAKICDAESNYFAYFVIIDIEATCTKDNPQDYKFEIIEFPAVLVDAKNQTIIDHFQAYVKPTINPKLSEFCTELTGITQSQIDSADPFPICLKRFKEWLKKHELGTKHTFSVVTDGSFDMGRFLYGQCIMSGIPYPAFATKWINIRKVFKAYYFPKNVKNSVPCNINAMLAFLGMRFEGSPHSGLDDSRNISRICIRLLEDGAFLDQNERIISLKNPTPFGKGDPLPIRPVHNIFCDGIHKKTQHWTQMKNLSLNDKK
ncbi:Ribonuclease H-like domain,Exonuclease, RNase T/DNA polymerase III [Cinara cedri]|uniref:Ribonuclease H-like domain,Exonuclease, RNase T/DNA polymerase III n=1 Tax=Cinara cedri TaxID=506608 RepID=A0A5E4MYA5_9HEMI|nr:Ribonuclease H-like domain,Exonuclease, RNase T/DNA polymerase III [Cinara cedri]